MPAPANSSDPDSVPYLLSPGLEGNISVQLHHEAGAQRESLLPGIEVLDVPGAYSSSWTGERLDVKGLVPRLEVELARNLGQVGFKVTIVSKTEWISQQILLSIRNLLLHLICRLLAAEDRFGGLAVVFRIA